MDDDDGQAQQRVHGFWMGVIGAIGLAVGVVVVFVFVLITTSLLGRIYPLATLVVGVSIGGMGAGIGSNIARKRFQPRFRKWLDAAGRAPRA
jgi:hypothetical protein